MNLIVGVNGWTGSDDRANAHPARSLIQGQIPFWVGFAANYCPKPTQFDFRHPGPNSILGRFRCEQQIETDPVPFGLSYKSVD
ncbi:MAG: hypothetical protein JJE13_09225 [Thermoleophilia bacterium]|nr:hypothetical protein [Thermoleophilia bacterium]